MKYIRALTAFLLCAALLLPLSACKSLRTGHTSAAALKVGVGEISGEFHPLYAVSDGDRAVAAQAFRTIQRRADDNKLINDCGGISYAFVGDTQVQYTVTIRDDLKFSDGTPVTIQDVIFFYYLISDASYNGVYSDFYLNDIEGLKAYYFDDENYAQALAQIDQTVNEKYQKSVISREDLTAYLEATSIAGLFDGADSASPYGATWGQWVAQADGSAPGDDAKALLTRIAKAEADLHWDRYDAAEWYRQSLMDAYIKRSYADNAHVTQISGIRKINDYTCTVLFNSRDINAISALNAVLLSEKFYGVNYVKGAADAVHEMGVFGVGCGAYCLSDFSGETVTMTANEYAVQTPAFSTIQMIDYAAAKLDPVDAVSAGKLDVVSVEAGADTVSRLNNGNVRYFVNQTPSYTTLYFNTATVESALRRAISGLCDFTDVLQARYGAYYTTLYRPLSIRFAEYPSSVSEPNYKESSFAAYQMVASSQRTALTAAYCAESPDGKALLEALAAKLNAKGITLQMMEVPAQGIPQAVRSGLVDLWVALVPDGDTCDKYGVYHSRGAQNLTGLSDETMDAMAAALHTGVGSGERAVMTGALLDRAMELAVECPLYQTQQITIYNIETVDAASLPADAVHYDGFTYLLPELKQV